MSGEGKHPDTGGDDWRVSCDSLDDVRKHIDRIDAVLVPLMCERHHFVREAAKFKPSVEKVVVPEREADIIARVRSAASERGVNPDAIEAVYRAMISAFTEDEKRNWRNLNKKDC